MAGANDLDRELEASNPVKITDGDEEQFSKIGQKVDGTYAQHVIAESYSLPSNSAAPIFSNNLKLHTNFDTVVLDADTGSFITIFSYTGNGKFAGFNAEFSQDTIQVKLTVDGKEVFNNNGNMWMDLGLLKGFGNKEILSDQVDFQFGMEFAPKFPMLFDTSVVIQARSATGANNRSKSKIIVMLTEEA